MRIGIDARLLYYQRAGISTYIRGLLGSLPSVACDDTFLVVQSRLDGESISSAANVAVSKFWTPCHHRYEQWLLPLELAFRTMDLLHSPDFIPPLRRRCPAVITIHDLAFLRYPSLLTPESARYYGQVDEAVASAEAIIAVSHSTKQDLLQLLGVSADKVRVVPEAAHPSYRVIENPQSIAGITSRYGLDAPYYLFVGTLEPRKNLSTLIKAYDLVRERLRAAGVPKLALVGRRGWLSDDIFDLVETMGLSSDVLFLGAVPPADLPALYNGALALTFVPLYEGFGLPALEAMACGLPVISSNVSSLPEVVGEDAMLVPPSDVEAIATAMKHIACDRDLREDLRRRGLQRAAQFSWERTARETLAVYHEVGSL